MKISRAASRYAKAVLDLSIDQDQAATVNSQMQHILATINNNKELSDFLCNPIINAAHKKQALHSIFPKAHTITNSTIDLLVDNKRANILRDVAIKYIILFEQLNQREMATVTTAIAIDQALEQQIINKATQLAGKQVTLDKKIDPSILGGFILRVGDQEINASVAHKLQELKQSFAVN